MRERRRASLREFLLRLAKEREVEGGMKESSRREVRYWARFEEMSERVW
jgi:hypothetical protein